VTFEEFTSTLPRKRMGAAVLLSDLSGRVLLVTDWVPPRAGRTEGVMFVFDGGVLPSEQVGQIRLPPDELRSWAWCTEQEAAARLSELSASRIAAAIRARAEGTSVYLENGFVVV
jgi:8-oxo-dGTP diphosphatase